ncbi:MAG: hypothetical protein LKI53_05615 [Bacteroidales bacterium]|nr:hypothetical protein [Bacteroidales bacterium]
MSYVLSVAVFAASACSSGKQVEQVAIPRVAEMPDMPSPYKMTDWRGKAVSFDKYVFDLNRKDEVGPLIWFDNHRRNVDQTTFGLYTAIHDVRQGAEANDGEYHESLNSMSAVLGAGLVRIDKTNQDGRNYVKMLQNYFNSDNGWNIIMNNTYPNVGNDNGGYSRDWWYNIFPNALYYAVCDVFPNEKGADEIQKAIAEQFVRADSVLDGNYDYSSFDYSKMQGILNNIPMEQDAAAGHAYVLLCAYNKFGDERYLRHSESALDALLSQKESRFYEVLMPLGIYTAAYLNATEGKKYDVAKMLDWVFDGCKSPSGRTGWGVITGKWGKYDVDGLQGSTTDGGGYAFLMNSIMMSWPLVPMVKYQPQYARAIGKWMLNMANACRLFYPEYIDPGNQMLPQMRTLTDNNIAYEGLRKTDVSGKPELKGVSPVALGDGPKWAGGNPPESMFSVYSSAPVGILGAIVDTTNVKGILKLDCNVTDFYSERPYPVFLYYNPYDSDREVEYYSGGKYDLFDVLSDKYMARNVSGHVSFEIPEDSARLIVQLPANTRLEYSDGKIIAGNRHIISYY